MMDLREIIKWFIPCFHILLLLVRKMDIRLTFVCLFLFLNSCAGLANVNSGGVDLSSNKIEGTKNLDVSLTDSHEGNLNFDQSDFISDDINLENQEPRSMADTSVGRTFGRPFKKMMSALIPLVFQVGAASTWAVVAALVGLKTLAITLIILKILLVAGAAKFGALFANKGHQSHGWEAPTPHQKEIHLHIHNGQHAHAEHVEEHPHYSAWSREGYPVAQETKNINLVIDPYHGGPQTISTPYGNYVKIDAPAQH